MFMSASRDYVVVMSFSILFSLTNATGDEA